MRRFLVTLTFAACLGACAHDEDRSPEPPIHHIVLLKLVEPSHAEALARDCRKLARIASVRALWCGQPAGIPKPDVDADYDVAFIAVFDSAEGYAAYEADPLHRELVAAWAPRLQWLRVHDVRERAAP